MVHDGPTQLPGHGEWWHGRSTGTRGTAARRTPPLCHGAQMKVSSAHISVAFHSLLQTFYGSFLSHKSGVWLGSGSWAICPHPHSPSGSYRGLISAHGHGVNRVIPQTQTQIAVGLMQPRHQHTSASAPRELPPVQLQRCGPTLSLLVFAPLTLPMRPDLPAHLRSGRVALIVCHNLVIQRGPAADPLFRGGLAAYGQQKGLSCRPFP